MSRELSGRRGRRADRRARRPARRRSRTTCARSSRSAPTPGAREQRVATSAEERALIWRGRKAAFAAMGRISPDYYVQDGVVPRTRLREVLRRIDELAAGEGLRVGNVFHAGDGNLHPLVLYDHRIAGQAQRAQHLAEQILEACIDAGGSITGEHGVGTDKACAMPLLFSEADLDAMARLRRGVRPARPREPGQGLPDAAAVRRGAGPLSRPPARARGARSSVSERPGVIEYEPGDLTVDRAGVDGARRRSSACSASRASACRSTRPVADARRVPARGPLRPAAPPLRHDARPRDRRDDGARRRHARELGRQGRQERRRLRPRQAPLRLARAARQSVERLALRLHPLPAVRAHRRDRRLALAGAAPLAARAERRRPRRRPSCTCSSRAPSARSAAQLRALGGEEGEPLGRDPRAAGDAARSPSLGARRGRAAGAPGPAGRPHGRGAPSERWSPLAERIVEAMWTRS